MCVRQGVRQGVSLSICLWLAIAQRSSGLCTINSQIALCCQRQLQLLANCLAAIAARPLRATVPLLHATLPSLTHFAFYVRQHQQVSKCTACQMVYVSGATVFTSVGIVCFMGPPASCRLLLPPRVATQRFVLSTFRLQVCLACQRIASFPFYVARRLCSAALSSKFSIFNFVAK